jgi:hypothetical protein
MQERDEQLRFVAQDNLSLHCVSILSWMIKHGS